MARNEGPADHTGAEILPNWEVYVVEEQPYDSEIFHITETIGWFVFVGCAEDVPCFVADMQTTDGNNPASLRCESTGAGP